jgi:hypothetical protein
MLNWSRVVLSILYMYMSTERFIRSFYLYRILVQFWSIAALFCAAEECKQTRQYKMTWCPMHSKPNTDLFISALQTRKHEAIWSRLKLIGIVVIFDCSHIPVVTLWSWDHRRSDAYALINISIIRICLHTFDSLWLDLCECWGAAVVYAGVWIVGTLNIGMDLPPFPPRHFTGSCTLYVLLGTFWRTVVAFMLFLSSLHSFNIDHFNDFIFVGF